ncbi:LamG domain-containing protein [Candidatus Woesearchaeota archaeon]|nr:LamG domain-containing protein [Candidatus Woesearchaeota archaeon]
MGTRMTADVNISNSTSLDIYNQITVEAWINPASLQSDRFIITKGSTGNKGWILYENNAGALRAWVTASTTASAEKEDVLASGVWQHIAFTYDGSNVRLYVNGTEQASAALSGAINYSGFGQLVFGHSENGPTGRMFNGSIDEVSIYNYAKSAAEIKADYDNSPYKAMIYKDAVGYWHLDSVNGSNVTLDATGNGNDGSLAFFNQTNATTGGIIGNALDFSVALSGTVNSRVRFPLTKGLGGVPAAANFSLSAWVKWTGKAQPNQNIVSANNWNNADSYGLHYSVSGDGKLYSSIGQQHNNGTGITFTPIVGRWYFIVGTATATLQSLYIDGELVSNTTVGKVAVAVTSVIPPSIGSASTSGVNGTVDEVGIWNKSLSASEVKQLYLRTWYDHSPQQFLLHPNYPDQLDNSTQNTTLLLHFNEGTGTTTADSSPYGNAGTISGAFFTNDSISGSALKFDGVNDYVQVNYAAILNITTNLTMSGWVKYSALPSGQGVIMGTWGGENNNKSYMLQTYGTGQVGFSVDGATEASSASNAVQVGQWFYIAGVIAGSNYTLFLNGKPVDSGAFAPPNRVGSENFYVGGDAGKWGLGDVEGVIDEVKIVNRSLSDAEIAAEYRKGCPFCSSDSELPTTTSGVVWQPGRFVENLTVDSTVAAYWRFDEVTGSTVYDISGNGNTGYNFTGRFTNDSVGGTAANFTTGKYFNVSNSNSLNVNGSLTIAAWVKIAENSTLKNIVEKGDSSTDKRQYALGIVNDNPRFRVERSAGADYAGIDSAYNLTVGRWYYIVGRYDQASRDSSIYIDGINTSGKRATGHAANLTPPFDINLLIGAGTSETPASFMNGSIDELIIYSKALSQQEILTNYKKAAKGLGLLSNDYINYSASSNFNEREGTIEFWVKPEWNGNGENRPHVFVTAEKTNNDFLIYKESTNELQIFVQDTIFMEYDVSGWTSGNWKHVAFTWNNYTSNMTLHVDGTQINNSGTAFTIPAQNYLALGAQNIGSTPATFCNCTLSEFRISRKALSAQEINESFSKSRQLYSNEFMLNRSNFAKGDSFKVEYTAMDKDNQTGSPVNSSFITVVNTPPVAVNLSLPASGTTVLDFVNITWNATTDADNDSFTYVVLVNGTTQCNNPNSVLNCTYTPSANGFYLYNITAFDGTENSTPTNGNFTFTNLAPNVTYYQPTPSDAAVITANTFTVNVSINETTVDSCRLELYNSTNASRLNYSMSSTKLAVGSPNRYYCNITVSTDNGVTYYYRVFANDTPIGATTATAVRSVRENMPANFSPAGLGSARNVSLNVSTVNPATGQPQSLIPGTTTPSTSLYKLSQLVGFAENYSDQDRDFEANSTFKWYKRTEAARKGLVGYWKLDGNANDNSGKGNDGNGTFVLGSGRIDGAQQFSTTVPARIINISGDPYNFGTGDFTVEFWTKDAASNGACLVSKWDNLVNSNPGWSIQYMSSGGAIRATINASGGGEFTQFTSDTANVGDGAWHHVAVTFDRDGSVVIYVDGTSKGSSGISGVSGSVNNNLHLRFGACHRGGADYSGSTEALMDEVSIYNYAKSAAEIKADYDNSPYKAMIYKDAVGYWHLDENGGTSGYADSSGSGNTGAPRNGTINTTGKINGGVTFGSFGYVNLSPITLNNFTVVAWLNPNGTSGAVVDAELCGITDDWGIHSASGKGGTVRFQFGDNSANKDFFLNSTGVLSNNTWSHLAVSRNGTTISFYINGILDNTATGPHTKDLGATSPECDIYGRAIGIGNQQRAAGLGTSTAFGGTIDEVGIWNKTLNASEVKQLYLRTWYDHSPQQFLLHPNYPEEVDNSTQNTTLLLHFNDVSPSNPNLTDSSPYGNNGNISGAFFTNDSISGSALSFDGSTSYVNITTDPDITSATNYLTVMLWVKATVRNAQEYMFARSPDANNYAPIILKQADQTISAVVDNAGTRSVQLDSVTKLQANIWTHVAFTFDYPNSNARLYINGKLENSTVPITAMTSTAAQASLGMLRSATFPLLGTIDELKIVNRSLTAAEIAADYKKGVRFGSSDGEVPTTESGVVWQPGKFVENLTVDTNTSGYWRFDEGTGQNVSDLSSFANFGVLGANGNAGTDDPTWVNDSAGGNALKFDGVNDYVDAGNASSLRTANITVEVWVKPNDKRNGANPGILYKGQTNNEDNGDYSFDIFNSNARFMVNNSKGQATGSTKLQNNTWHHIVGTYDASASANNMKVYVNGILEAQSTYSGGINSTGNSLKIGYYYSSGFFCNCTIDEVRILNRSLSAAEILSDYRKAAKGVYFGQGAYLNYSDKGNQNNNVSGNNYDEGTVESWVKLDSSKGNSLNMIADFESTGSNGLTFHINAGKLRLQYGNGSTNTVIITTTTTLAKDIWHHVAATWSSSGTAVYVNGVLEASGGDPVINISDINPGIFIGAQSPGTTRYLNGTLSEFRISRKALSAQEINESFSKGRQYFSNEIFLNNSNFNKWDSFKLGYQLYYC